MEYLIKSINDFSEKDINSFVKRIKEPKKTILFKLNKKNFKQFVIGEMLLEVLLKKNNINYDDVNIEYNINGKPLIINYPLNYNISHSDNMVICGVCELPIGVDIQKKKVINLDVKKVFCSKKELGYIDSVDRFYELFSLKESYLKMNGLKINDIKKISLVNNNHVDLGNDYNYEIINDNDYVISICYERFGGN